MQKAGKRVVLQHYEYELDAEASGYAPDNEHPLNSGGLFRDKFSRLQSIASECKD